MIKINLNQLLWDLLPVWWRTGNTYSLYQGCASALQEDYNWFDTYAWENDYELLHNSQKMSMEQWINYHVPTTLGITIGNGQWHDSTFLYFNSEINVGFGYPTYVYFNSENSSFNPYIYFNSELGSATYDFSVNIHTVDADTLTLNVLKGKLNTIKLAGTNYKINYL